MSERTQNKTIVLGAAGCALALGGCGDLGLAPPNVMLNDQQVKEAVVPAKDLSEFGITGVDFQGQQSAKTLRTNFQLTGVQPKGECAEVIKKINTQKEQVNAQTVFVYQTEKPAEQWNGIVASIDDEDADPFALYGRAAEVCTPENLDYSTGVTGDIEQVGDGQGVLLTLRVAGKDIKVAAAGIKVGKNHAVVYVQSSDLSVGNVEKYLEKQKSALEAEVKKAAEE